MTRPRLIILLSLLALLPAAFSCTQKGPAPASALIRPGYLAPGDTVLIVEPSFHQADTAAAVVSDILREWGYVPVTGPRVGSVYADAYAGTPQLRAEDLRWALGHPSARAILCLGGGYGTIQLVPLMDADAFRAHPKWLIGFSDITTLHAMSVSAGVMSLHATVGGLMARYGGEDPSSLALRDFLAGTGPSEYRVSAHPENVPGEASGTLVGGNLCTFATLYGTWADFLAATEGDLILVIEEVEETWHSIDRLMNLLKLTGRLDRVKGVVLGEFTDCPADLGYDSPEALIVEEYLRPLGIPVACGFPFGHEFENNLPFVEGASVTLSVTPEGAVLQFER